VNPELQKKVQQAPEEAAKQAATWDGAKVVEIPIPTKPNGDGPQKLCATPGCAKPARKNANYCSSECPENYKKSQHPDIDKQLLAMEALTLDKFMAEQYPAKTPLIEDILHKRDRISLTGRRRNGKTTILLNLALAGVLPLPEYLGFKVRGPFRVLAFFLEDDGAELQNKLKKLLRGQQLTAEQSERFHIYTRSHIRAMKLHVDISDAKFCKFIAAACKKAKPDLIIFDNLGMLISGNYNDSVDIHKLMEITFDLGDEFNAAYIIAAHPRKQSTKPEDVPTLRSDRVAFYEMCMGSSHFINSTGSTWGIDRSKRDPDQTDLDLGAERVTGYSSLTVATMNDAGWLERVDDSELAAATVLNTKKRLEAWRLLVQRGADFNYTEAHDAVKAELKNNNSFAPWWKELKRQLLIVPTEDVKDDRYRCVRGVKLPKL